MNVKHIMSKCSRISKAVALHLAVAGVLLGCNGKKLTAEEHIANGNYNKAAEQLEEQYAETKKKPDEIEIASMVGSKTDFGITLAPNRESVFLSSNRLSSKIADNYQLTERPQSYYVYGTVYLLEDIKNLGSKKIFTDGAEVTFEIQRTRDKSGSQKFTVGKDGKFKFKIDKGLEFNLLASSPSFDFINGLIDKETHGSSKTWNSSRDTTIDLYLASPKEYVILGIYYNLDAFSLRPESCKVLDSLASIFRKYDFMVVELGSHTDCRAPIAYNDTLSQKKSQICVNYLIGQGIAPQRLVAKGYGERKLVNDCGCENVTVGRRTVLQGPGANCTEAEHQANRRTTVALLRTDYHAPKVEEEEGEEEEYIEGIEE